MYIPSAPMMLFHSSLQALGPSLSIEGQRIQWVVDVDNSSFLSIGLPPLQQTSSNINCQALATNDDLTHEGRTREVTSVHFFPNLLQSLASLEPPCLQVHFSWGHQPNCCGEKNFISKLFTNAVEDFGC